LCVAMAECGRPVSIAILTKWRKAGLLPSFASQGDGSGGGRSYYWNQENILEHACYAYDLIQSYGRFDTAVFLLWLSGYQAPVLRVRRAWLNRVRTRKPWSLQVSTSTLSAKLYTKVGKFSEPDDAAAYERTPIIRGILNGALTVYDALVSDKYASELELLYPTFERVIATIAGEETSASGAQNAESVRLLNLLKVVSSTIESSDLLTQASEAEMLEAWRYLCVAAHFIRVCTCDWERNFPVHSAPAVLPADLAEHVGAPLFLFILILLRAGYRYELELTAVEIERTSKQIETRKTECGAGSHISPRDCRHFRRRISDIWREFAFVN
jgi:hypothetical protein